jgi:hypothetical protein
MKNKITADEKVRKFFMSDDKNYISIEEARKELDKKYPEADD